MGSTASWYSALFLNRCRSRILLVCVRSLHPPKSLVKYQSSTRQMTSSPAALWNAVDRIRSTNAVARSWAPESAMTRLML